jgi:hypothetical protein
LVWVNAGLLLSVALKVTCLGDISHSIAHFYYKVQASSCLEP